MDLDILTQALAALEANHEHHKEYGADAGYSGSELSQQNQAAITALRRARAAQHFALERIRVAHKGDTARLTPHEVYTICHAAIEACNPTRRECTLTGGMDCGGREKCEVCPRWTEAKPCFFYQSGQFVRGPSRPSGSGYKEFVIKLPTPKHAQWTADSLNDFAIAFSTGRLTYANPNPERA